ncbi:hypothetical protein VaNZ11_006969 [Volvox africanus]|uniref:U-box domain-containing protein n=1 Tax=Volvox africanus TaxID=51714 RepID=A0ABQ5S359_9CHLO|nr:hypothetical protein VaNZ11_006969 [Volvox africanus]
MGNFVSTPDAAFKPSDAFFIFDAAKNGSIDIVRLFLEKSKWLAYATDTEESTPWHVAAAEGYDAVVKVLIDAALVNKTSEGSLLKLINRKNAKGQTPLMLACGRGHVTCARLLLDSGAALLFTDATGRSALHHAALYPGVDSKGDCVGLFLEYMQRRLFLERHKFETHASIIRRHADAADKYGRTPLHCAAWSGNVRAVHTLWMVGADICSQTTADCFDSDLPCNRGSTALHFAAIRGHQQVVVLLLAAWHRLVTRPESPLPRPAYAKELMRERQEAAEGRIRYTVGGEREPEPAKAPVQDQDEEGHGALQGTSFQSGGERCSELSLPCGESDGLEEHGTESGKGQGTDQGPEAAGTCGEIETEGQTGGPSTKHQRDTALPENGASAPGAVDVRASEAASARGFEPASGTGKDGSDGISNSHVKDVDVPMIKRVDFPPPPLPPPARIDPRLIVDGYGLSPYDYARKNKEQRGLMFVELLDAATDFCVDDMEDESGSEDGLPECGVGEASSGRGRGRRGSRAYGRGRGSEDDDADSDVAAAGSLLLWDGVELVQDIAADPDSFFTWQHSARFLQSHLEGDGKEGQTSAKEEHGRPIPTIPSRFSVTTEVIPDCFLCPMTCKVFRDPVVAADGVTYERDAIERHLRHVSTSPMTKQYLPSKQLYANNALKSAIAQWSSGLLPPGGARGGDDRIGGGTGL